MMRIVLRRMTACALAVISAAALAQGYPSRPVKIMVGANAGGGTDIIARMLGDKYTEWIGADNTLIGQKAGEFIAKWCKDNTRTPCNVAEIRGLEGSTPAKERGDGFRTGGRKTISMRT